MVNREKEKLHPLEINPENSRKIQLFEKKREITYKFQKTTSFSFFKVKCEMKGGYF